MNLLTMIPITGKDDKELRYFVGVQVDMVEKPTSVEGKNASALYRVDYSQGALPRVIWSPPEAVRQPLDGVQILFFGEARSEGGRQGCAERVACLNPFGRNRPQGSTADLFPYILLLLAEGAYAHNVNIQLYEHFGDEEE